MAVKHVQRGDHCNRPEKKEITPTDDAQHSEVQNKNPHEACWKGKVTMRLPRGLSVIDL